MCSGGSVAPGSSREPWGGDSRQGTKRGRSGGSVRGQVILAATEEGGT